MKTAPEWIPYASVGLALASTLIAVLFGLSNRATAKEALKLSQRQEARRKSRIDLYLLHKVSWAGANPGDRTLGISAQVANASDRESSITQIELHVSYSVDEYLTKVRLPAMAGEASAELLEGKGETLRLPLRLLANDAQTGWATFDLPAGLLQGQPVDRFDFVVRDLHGIEESLQVSVFPEESA